MFAGHLSSISIKRVEPESSYNFKEREIRLNKYFSQLAEKIVIADVMKNPIKSVNKEKAQKKLIDNIEKDERLKTVKGFMSSWNFWRDFYFGLGEIYPKEKSQLTGIENAIQFCEENEYDLHMMIGCLHYAHKKKKFKPAFTSITTYGAEVYKFHDQVVSDLDKDDYRTSSMERA